MFRHSSPAAVMLGSALISLMALPAQAAYPVQTTPDSGGEGSVAQFDHNAYSLPLGNMSMTKRLDFSVGNSFFRNPWVEAPASTDARDGLGPLINTNSCQGCHIKDGRGHPPSGQERAVPLFLRLSLPSQGADPETLKRQGVNPLPHYGGQLQTAAISGFKAEADMQVSYTEKSVTLDDGDVVSLQVPEYRISNPAYGPLPDDLLTSPRVAPPMIGLGLLDTIPAERIAERADPEDRDGDGISGRINRVWDAQHNETVLGRFGWKAGQPTVEQQSLRAFADDMGLTSTLFPHTDCRPSQNCESMPNGGSPEVSDDVADFVSFYAASLAVPKRRHMDDPQVKAGAETFNDLGCAACHTPRQQTGPHATRPELANQTIWPYSDLLLHDMGEGLADGRPEFQATGTEWRTPPLWGIGLAQEVNPQAGFLHDGRARTLEEAILWHGGEAEPAAAGYRALSKSNRLDLLRFLESL